VQNQWRGSPPKTCPFPYWLGLPNLVFLRSLNGISVIKEIRLKIWFLPSRLWRSLKVIGTHTDRSAISDFLLLCQLYGTVSYRFRDKRRLQSKIAKFSHPRAFCAPRISLELGTSARGQKLEWWSYRAEKEVWRYHQPSGYNTPTWRTVGQTDTGWEQRPRLRIASRGKKLSLRCSDGKSVNNCMNARGVRSVDLWHHKTFKALKLWVQFNV